MLRGKKDAKTLTTFAAKGSGRPSAQRISIRRRNTIKRSSTAYYFVHGGNGKSTRRINFVSSHKATTMPMLIDYDLTGIWPSELGAETPTDALVAAPAYCFISDGAAYDPPIARQLTEADAELLIERLKRCDAAIFGMEVPAGRVEPFYVAAFARSGDTSELTHYYAFSQRSELALQTHVIFRLTEKFLRNHEAVHSCHVPLPLSPPTHFESDTDGRSREVLSSPALSCQSTNSGVVLFLDQ